MAKLTCVLLLLGVCGAFAAGRPRANLRALTNRVRGTGFPHGAMKADNGRGFTACATQLGTPAADAEKAVERCTTEAWPLARDDQGTKAAMIRLVDCAWNNYRDRADSLVNTLIGYVTCCLNRFRTK